MIPPTLSEVTGPIFGPELIKPNDNDLTKQHKGEPLGERIIVTGRVMDENARPVRNTLIEIWQANAAGRYRHDNDQHDAPLDPNFSGSGRIALESSRNWVARMVHSPVLVWNKGPSTPMKSPISSFLNRS